ncbi:MAG: hypothetical protein ACREUG_01655 [Steroidobacteraceae bacterium]
MQRSTGRSRAQFRVRSGALAAGVAGAALAALVAGCGASSVPGIGAASGGEAARAAAHRLAPHKTAQPGAVGSADLVAAVGSDKSNVPVDVRFALRQRPEVGKPVELDVQITPSAPLGKVVTTFHADDGLTIQAGGAATESVRPEPGVPLSRTLTIVAQRDGIFYVKATVLVDAGADSIARTFTIPIIGGAGTS